MLRKKIKKSCLDAKYTDTVGKKRQKCDNKFIVQQINK